MKIYLAACFKQQREVREKAEELEQLGHVCTSNWRFETDTGDGSETDHADKYRAAAKKDLEDIDAADALVLLAGQISFTGGKHVETGYALAKGKRVVVVGPAENVFHWILERYSTWEELKCRL